MSVAVPNSGPAWLTLDPSWQITLNWIRMKELTWGTDAVFTYGPLAFLSTRMAWNINPWSFLLFDLFLAVNYFCLFYDALNRKNSGISWLFVIGIVLLLPLHLGSGVALVLFSFLLYWVIKSLDSPGFFNYLMQGITFGLLFFIKLNTGLVSFLIILTGVIYQLKVSRMKFVQALIYLILMGIGIGISGRILKVEFAGYLRGSLSVISGYNDIMYLHENYKEEFVFALTVIALIFFILIRKCYIDKKIIPKNVVVLALVFLVLLVLYKQAFVRADIQHILEFYKYLFLFLIAVPDLTIPDQNRYSRQILTGIAFVVLFFGLKREVRTLGITDRFSKESYIGSFSNWNDSLSIDFYRNPKNILPESIRTKVADASIDLYPWNTQLLIENRMNYVPRPVFQSNSAYTSYLADLNVDFYNSAKAPDYLIYEYSSLDNRYPMGDESKLNALFFSKYECMDTFRFSDRLHLLLKRKSNVVLTFNKTASWEAGIGSSIVPESDRFYQIKSETSLTGKCISFLDHTPVLVLKIVTQDSVWHEYRTSVNLLQSGLYLNRFFNSTDEIYRWLKGDSIQSGLPILFFQVVPENPSLYKDKLTVDEYSIQKVNK